MYCGLVWRVAELAMEQKKEVLSTSSELPTACTTVGVVDNVDVDCNRKYS